MTRTAGPPRTIAIGDIHGCSVALEALLAAIDPKADDTIVALGDFIDRGIDTKGVIERLIGLSTQCHLVVIQGNHEQMLLDAIEDRSKLRQWLQYGESTLMSYGVESLDALPKEHVDFIRSIRDFYETSTHIFLHATYAPNLSIEDHSSLFLRWEPFAPDGLSSHYSGKKVIVGHTRQESGEVLDLGFACCIDTGCCKGGWLTAMDVNTEQIWQANQAGNLRRQDNVPKMNSM